MLQMPYVCEECKENGVNQSNQREMETTPGSRSTVSAQRNHLASNFMPSPPSRSTLTLRNSCP